VVHGGRARADNSNTYRRVFAKQLTTHRAQSRHTKIESTVRHRSIEVDDALVPRHRGFDRLDEGLQDG
jgi:hypothetical protein